MGTLKSGAWKVVATSTLSITWEEIQATMHAEVGTRAAAPGLREPQRPSPSVRRLQIGKGSAPTLALVAARWRRIHIALVWPCPAAAVTLLPQPNPRRVRWRDLTDGGGKDDVLDLFTGPEVQSRLLWTLKAQLQRACPC